MSEDFTVVIWGAGALGFGLVGALAYEAGHEVVAVVRHSTTNKAKADRVESLQTRHRYTVGDADPRVVRLAKVIRNDTTQGRTALDRLLRTRKNILFCTTARAGQSDAVPIIERAREERRRDGNPGVLLLAPCENEVASPLAALKVSLAGPGFGYLDSMVDRICFEPVSRSGLVHVSCEPGYEWAYELTSGERSKKKLDGVVACLDSMHLDRVADISPVKQRKLWMMNGTLLSLALLARGHGSDVHATLNEYLALFPVSCELLLAELSRAVDLAGLGYSTRELEEQERLYRMRIYESARMSEARSQDEVTRILSRLSSGRPASYLRDVLGKLAEPIELLKQHGESDLLCAEALRIGFLLASETLD